MADRPTEAECWERFWRVVAIEHANVCRREALERANKEAPAN